MPLDEFKTQVLLLHSDQRKLDSLGSQFSDRYTLHFATSGSQALSTLAEAPINIIISAHDLPGMSGPEALREAKKRSPGTIGFLLTDSDGDEIEALVGDEEVFQVVRSNIDVTSLLELVEFASREQRLATLSQSANDNAAAANFAPDHIIMETANNGESIITASSTRLRALNPGALAAAPPVDILVLTEDDEFLRTIRLTCRSQHEVHAAKTLAEANDIIRDHTVGVAVVDAGIVRHKIEQLTQHLCREAPRLVPVVAGRRDDGEMLMNMINRGSVYRFLLKPVSPGRARLAIAASVRHHIKAPDAAFSTSRGDQATPPEEAQAAETPDAADTDPAPDSAAAPVSSDASPEAVAAETAPATRQPPADTMPAESGPMKETAARRLSDMVDAATASARRQKGRGKLLGVVAAGAVIAIGAALWFGLFSDKDITVPEASTTTPTLADAGAGSPAAARTPTVEQALQIAETALMDARLQVADTALQQVAEADPGNARLPFLTAQLTQAQLRMSLADARTAIREGRLEDAADALLAAQALDVQDTAEIDALAIELDTARSNRQTGDVLALADARLESGDLVTPEGDSARYYFELVLANDSENTAARQGLDIIANRLVLQARSEIDNGNYEFAQELLYAVRAIDSTNAEMIATADALQLAREAAEKATARAAAEQAAAENAAAEEAAAEQAAAESAAAEKAAAENAAAENAAAENAAVETAAPERAATERAAAERTAAEEAVVEAAAAERESAEADIAQTAAGLPVAASAAEQPAGSNAPVETADAAEAAASDRATAEKPVDTMPIAISSLVRTNYVAPKFPRSAVRRNQSGWVDLAFTVSIDGSVKDIAIRESSPGDLFDAAATRAVEQWLFEPVVEDGVLIEKRAAVRMMFSLD